MDFSNRNVQSQAAAPAPTSVGASNRKNKADKGKWGRVGVVVAVIVVAVLLVAFAILAAGGNSDKKESSFVDNSKLQAVFLNTGQVYFGNIKALNNRYVELTNIYYLQTANSGTGQNANTSVSLVKLGCELHEPLDKMLINRDQVTFWENLGENGQVAKAVSTFEKQNPNGQKCADQSSAASTNSGNTTQNAGTGTNNTTNKTPTNP